MTTIKMPQGEGFGFILELASKHGWSDTFGSAHTGDWSPEDADACEESALEYLATQDVFVLDEDGEPLN